MMRSVYALATLVLLTITVGGQARANLIQNGGFEVGLTSGMQNPIPDWTGTGAFETPTFYYAPTGLTYTPHSGSGFAEFPYHQPESISQQVATTPGVQYTLSYWFASDGYAPNSFQVSWDSTVLYSENNITSLPYMQFSFTVTGTGSDTVYFSGFNTPGYQSLDDVSLNPASVPEPSGLTLAMIASSVACGLGYARRRRPKRDMT